MWSPFVASLAIVSLASGTCARLIKRQDGPVDPSTDPDCTFFDTAVDQSYNCAYFEDYWGLSHADFVAWNPSVEDDCSGLVVGNSYCIEVTRSTTRTSSTTSAATTSAAPSPTAPGMIESCTTYYKAQRGDTCPKIVDRYRTFTQAQFQQWNPSVGSDCTGLQAEVYYCVGIPGTPTSAPSSSTAPTNGISTPTPTQPGMVNNCNAFYFVKPGDGCQAIADQAGIFLAQFISWQDVGGETCSRLQANVNVCVNIIGNTPTTSTSTTSTMTTPTNGIQTPTPTQPGMVNNCDAFYFVKPGDGCQAIADRSGISLAQFISWQDVGGESCSRLQANVNVCIDIIGNTPTTSTSTTSTSTTPTNGIQTPTPTQPGMVNNCDAFYKVVSGDGCQSIADTHGITLDQFISWQDVGGASCPRLQLGVNVCVSIVGHSPTFTTATPSSTCATAHPTPTSPQTVCNCRRWHKVVSGNTCEAIQKQYGQSAANLNRWNPSVGFGGNCGKLWTGYNICVNSPL